MNKNLIDVVAGIVMVSDKILCARRKEGLHLAGYWEFAGGKVEVGECNEHALERELFEELGVNVDVGPYVGQSTFTYESKTVRLHAYICSNISGEITLNDHDEICWLTVDVLDQLKWAHADVSLIHQLKTFLYYEKNASLYANKAFPLPTANKYSSFLSSIPKNGHILDLGCGSGRDSLAFMKHGYRVTATDTSPEVTRIASRNIMQEVFNFSCFNMNVENKLDGIWACASLLHLPKSEIKYALNNIMDALKVDGCAYISLKYGEGEAFDNEGRFCSFYKDEELKYILKGIANVSSVKIWVEKTQPYSDKNHFINALVYKAKSSG